MSRPNTINQTKRIDSSQTKDKTESGDKAFMKLAGTIKRLKKLNKRQGFSRK